jgi:hypothetical protein
MTLTFSTSPGMRGLLAAAVEAGARITLEVEHDSVEPTYSIEEVVVILGVRGADAVRSRVRSGELPAVVRGNEVRFLCSDVETYSRIHVEARSVRT